MSVPKNRFGRGGIILLLGLLLLISTQYLNHTGFCYAEMKYLSERELTDRFLFGDQARSMSDKEKVDVLKARNGAEYPDCCRVHKGRFGWSSFETAFNSALGNYRYGFEYNHPVEKTKTGPEDLFRWLYYSINSCGSRGYPDSGDRNSRDLYEGQLNSNRSHWKDLEDANAAH